MTSIAKGLYPIFSFLSLLLSLSTFFLLKARLGQTIVVGALNASLFLQLDADNAQTMLGFLFAATLTGGLSNMSMIPLILGKERDGGSEYRKIGGRERRKD